MIVIVVAAPVMSYGLHPVVGSQLAFQWAPSPIFIATVPFASASHHVGLSPCCRRASAVGVLQLWHSM